MDKNNLKKNLKSVSDRSVSNEKKQGFKINKPLMVILSLIILVSLFLMLPIFRIQTIEIRNADFVSIEKLLAYSDIKENQHFLQGMGGKLKDFFAGRYAKAEDNILEKVPQVSDISITYSFPNTVIFDVTERIAIGWIKIPDGYCTIDSKGVVIEILNEEPEDLPIIKGIEIVNLNLGKQIDVDQSEYLKNAMYTMSALIEADLDLAEPRLLHSINAIEPTINGNIYLHMTLAEQKILVICNQSHELKENFLWLNQLVNNNTIADKGSGTIDLRGKTRTFKPTSETEPPEPEAAESEITEMTEVIKTTNGGEE